MDDRIDILKEGAYSKSKEESIRAIEELVTIVNKIGDIFLETLKGNDDRFIITEKISLAYASYLDKIRRFIHGSDKELSFWAATLILNYQIMDPTAEKILLDSVLLGELDKAYIATTILCRVKNSKIKQVISQRLKDISLSKQAVDFFVEKLDSLSSAPHSS